MFGQRLLRFFGSLEVVGWKCLALAGGGGGGVAGSWARDATTAVVFFSWLRLQEVELQGERDDGETFPFLVWPIAVCIDQRTRDGRSAR